MDPTVLKESTDLMETLGMTLKAHPEVPQYVRAAHAVIAMEAYTTTVKAYLPLVEDGAYPGRDHVFAYVDSFYKSAKTQSLDYAHPLLTGHVVGHVKRAVGHVLEHKHTQAWQGIVSGIFPPDEPDEQGETSD